MKQGVRFIVHHAALLFVILALASGMFVLGCFGPLIAVYVRDTLHGSTKVFGVASAMIGIGMLLGINALNAFAKNIKNTVLVYSGLGGIAVGLVMLTVLGFVWSTIVGNFIIGFSVAGIIIPTQTMIQQETPSALMGRVGSTVMSTIFTAQILGLVASGLLTERIGVRQVFAVCAGMLVVLIVVGKLFMEPKGEAAE
jgi:MFS family permease